MFQRHETAATLTGVEACRTFFADCMAVSPDEDGLWVAHVDGEARCIHLAAYPAGAELAELPVALILREAVELGSVGMIVAQRRKGAASTSASERQTTQTLSLAAEAMDIALLDHLLFHGRECRSLRRAGLL